MAKKYILGVDVGTGSVKALAGMVNESGDIAILGSGTVATAGINKGKVVNVGELAAAVKEAAECAAAAAKIPADAIYLGIGGPDVSSENSLGSIDSYSTTAITAGDLESACGAALIKTVAEDQRILHVLPIRYWLDGENLGREPLGKCGTRLEVEAHVVTIPETVIGSLVNILATKGHYIAGVTANLITGTQVLLETANDCLVMDFGAGVTDVVIYSGGKIVFSASLPLGGEYITGDIVQGIGVSRLHAEGIKRYYARLSKALRGQKVMLDCNDYGTTDKHVSFDFLYTIVESRVEEMVAIIMESIESSLSRYPVNKILLTGGGSLLPSVAECLERSFGMPVQLTTPKNLPAEYAHPGNSACFGVLSYAARHSLVKEAPARPWHSLVRKIKDLI
ncbi:MAG: cell division protein FtsA [Negativicutes bacterium]|nr:cell division protein FtsA [Negativicutes bacterium]